MTKPKDHVRAEIAAQYGEEVANLIPPVEAAKIAGVGVATIQRWARTGVIKGYRTAGGKLVYVRRSELLTSPEPKVVSDPVQVAIKNDDALWVPGENPRREYPATEADAFGV
jgi:excisionase family DNA binding protein